MYHVSAQGVDERMINVHYYYYPLGFLNARLSVKRQARCQEMFGEGGSGAGGEVVVADAILSSPE